MHLRFREHERHAVARSALEEASGRPLAALREAFDPLVQVGGGLAPEVARLRTRGYVGTLQVGGLRVDVMPRLAASDLVALIRYAWSGEVARGRSAVAAQRLGVADLLCALLAAEAERIQREGLSRQYVPQRERTAALRGRPDFVGSFPWNPDGRTTLVCRFHELTYDNLDNRLLLAALRRASLMELHPAVRQQVVEHRSVWQHLAEPLVPRPEDFRGAREQYTRLNRHYRLAHALAERIVFGHEVGQAYEEGAVATSGLVLNMARLFEDFAERAIRAWATARGLGVRSQATDQGALLDGRGARYRSIRPDLVVYDGTVPVAVLDAKYKMYWRARADGEPKRRISNGDLYQLFFYAQRLQHRHGLAAPPAALILAPQPGAAERPAEPIGSRYRHVVWRAQEGGDHAVRLVLLPLSEMLTPTVRIEEVMDERLTMSVLASA